jgi:hypothetical protein
VEGDQLLERTALIERGVVEAADEQVGRVRETVGAKKMLRRRGREERQRILAVDAVLLEIASAVRAEHDGPVLVRADEHPADVRVRAQRLHESRMARLQLVERHPPAFLHQVDEAEIP